MIYDDRDDGMREQRQNEISDYFDIIIDDENIIPNWDILIPTIKQQIENFEFDFE